MQAESEKLFLKKAKPSLKKPSSLKIVRNHIAIDDVRAFLCVIVFVFVFVFVVALVEWLIFFFFQTLLLLSCTTCWSSVKA